MQAAIKSELSQQMLAPGSNLRQAYIRFSQQPDTAGVRSFADNLLAHLRKQQQSIENLQRENKWAEAEEQKTELLHSVNTVNSMLRTMQVLKGRPIGKRLDNVYATPFGEQRLWISPLLRNSQIGAYIDVLDFLGIQVDRKELQPYRKPVRTNANAA
jgi:hypothetical protein